MTFSQDEQNQGPELLLKGSDSKPLPHFSMCLPQEAGRGNESNVVHSLALIHPKKKLINCQHPRHSLFF